MANGNSVICRAVIVPPISEDSVSILEPLASTVTVSVTAPALSSTLSAVVLLTDTCTFLLVEPENPAAVTVTE